MLRLGKDEEGFAKRYPDRIVTIDSHTQGEPTRLLIGGIGELPGGINQGQKGIFRIKI
jgi:proline racemase